MLACSICCVPATAQVLFELLTWRLPWTFADMSPFKVGAAGTGCLRPGLFSCTLADGARPTHFHGCRSEPLFGGAGGPRCHQDSSCPAPTPLAGQDWSPMCS